MKNNSNSKLKLVLIGPPGSGKGTQALKLKDHFDIPHISSGDVLRHEVSIGSDFGKKIKQFMDKGEIGPVELITEVICNYIKTNASDGFILDGFPRTLYQARELEKDHSIDAALFIDVPLEEIVTRITGRRICKECGTIFHLIYSPPVKENICDKCGTGLTHRSDDNEETVINRINVYNNETKPVLDFYKERNLLQTIKGNGAAGDIFSDICKILS